jgi:Cu(I)/Ag(I) efflux system protein CusF
MEFYMKAIMHAAFFAAVAFVPVSGVYAQAAQANVNTTGSMSSGEVKKIDKSAGKMTIKHGPLKNLGMDGMTMVFRAKDPAMLDQVNVGDKIYFVAEKADGQLTVTRLERQDQAK